ncbi:MAG: sigma-70 family RNA polymerase sigma factor [Planctomycetota bacterium]
MSTFAELHRELGDDLAAWAHIQVRQAAIAGLDGDDLAQETWSRAFAGFGGFDPQRGDFRAWLFGIGYHVLRKQLRALGSAARRERTPADGDDVPDGATSIVTRLDRSERARRLTALVAALPAEDQLLVLYRGLEGLPHAEVGARLELTADAAEARWRRVREKLVGLLPRE